MATGRNTQSPDQIRDQLRELRKERLPEPVFRIHSARLLDQLQNAKKRRPPYAIT